MTFFVWGLLQDCSEYSIDKIGVSTKVNREVVAILSIRQNTYSKLGQELDESNPLLGMKYGRNRLIDDKASVHKSKQTGDSHFGGHLECRSSKKTHIQTFGVGVIEEIHI